MSRRGQRTSAEGGGTLKDDARAGAYAVRPEPRGLLSRRARRLRLDIGLVLRRHRMQRVERSGRVGPGHGHVWRQAVRDQLRPTHALSGVARAGGGAFGPERKAGVVHARAVHTQTPVVRAQSAGRGGGRRRGRTKISRWRGVDRSRLKPQGSTCFIAPEKARRRQVLPKIKLDYL